MTDTHFAKVEGIGLKSAVVRVDDRGPWVAEIVFDGEAPGIAGRVSLTIGTDTLSGTILPTQDGVYAQERRCTIVGGAAGWGKLVAGKDYHNDAGVKARLVADDVARAAGETIGTFLPASEKLAFDYVRTAEAPASRALEDAAGDDVPWHVDYDGVTNVGARAALELPKGTYEVMAFDPASQVATLSLDDIASLRIGSIITERVTSPLTVRSYELRVTTELRATCSTGAADTDLSRLFAALVRREMDERLLGTFVYRVITMAVDGRVNLQAVRRGAGLPDVSTVPMWSAPGYHAELRLGGEVLLSFIEGDRARPFIAAFAGKTGVGHVPQSVTIAGSVLAAARLTDSVRVTPSVALQATFGAPAATGPMSLGTPYPVTFTPNFIDGVITSGSPKVNV